MGEKPSFPGLASALVTPAFTLLAIGVGLVLTTQGGSLRKVGAVYVGIGLWLTMIVFLSVIWAVRRRGSG